MVKVSPKQPELDAHGDKQPKLVTASHLKPNSLYDLHQLSYIDLNFGNFAEKLIPNDIYAKLCLHYDFIAEVCETLSIKASVWPQKV